MRFGRRRFGYGNCVAPDLIRGPWFSLLDAGSGAGMTVQGMLVVYRQRLLAFRSDILARAYSAGVAGSADAS